MKTFDIEMQTAVELPDRHVMSPFIVVVLDANGNTINVLDANSLATALSICGTQIGGNVLSVSGQAVYCKAPNSAFVS